jgi:hypothetical protein
MYVNARFAPAGYPLADSPAVVDGAAIPDLEKFAPPTLRRSVATRSLSSAVPICRQRADLGEIAVFPEYAENYHQIEG